MNDAEREHLEKVRNRFTNTAEPFSQFVLSQRSNEAQMLVTMATEGLALTEHSVALDVGCGPGTLSLAVAARVGRVVGMDLTHRILLEAWKAAERAGLANLSLARADAYALPFAEARFDLAVCGYTLHHLLDPGRVVRNMAEVVRSGGRVALLDMLVPKWADGDMVNRIERTRDASHATTLDSRGLQRLLTAAGLRVMAMETNERQRKFDDWMHVAGLAPGSEGYEKTSRLMRASAGGDTAGYRPRRNETNGTLEFVQTSQILIAEKP